jgi:hypothetical protein
MNTIENNILLAEFMQPSFNGFGTYDFDGQLLTKEYLKFHSDWNWLMQVVEKIESLNVVVEVRENVCYIEETSKEYFSELEVTKILATYKACVHFVKCYNEQNK